MITAGLTAPPSPVLARMRRIAATLAIDVDLEWLVAGRARSRGLTSRGRISANGSCRLLLADDGWVAINLPRPIDHEALPAVVQGPVDEDDPWAALARFARTRPARMVADRCQLLEVAGAVLDDPDVDATTAAVTTRVGEPAPVRATPLVVDLSAMWAGPLCAHLLGRTGMEVVTVESTSRPDGLRAGDPSFFAELRAGHERRTLDFGAPGDRAVLGALLRAADVVIESSRPRALQQLGIEADELVAARPGRTWVSITGYGRADPRQRVAFGDDAAVAGGLVERDDDGQPVFCADAVADPLTGLLAAAAVLRSVQAGGGHLVDVSMAAVVKSLVTGP